MKLMLIGRDICFFVNGLNATMERPVGKFATSETGHKCVDIELKLIGFGNQMKLELMFETVIARELKFHDMPKW